MKHIDTFEQLREAAEAAKNNLKKPFQVFVRITMITMVQLRKVYSIENEARLSECMLAGESMPPLKGVYDLSVSELYCWDGEHRLNAAKKNGETHILVDLSPGSKRDAILFAAGANDSHGLGRTTQDKISAVAALLDDAEWRGWSSTRIAKVTRTSVPFVEKLRQEKESPTDDETVPAMRKAMRNGKEFTMKLSGKRKKDPATVALDKIMKLVEPLEVDARRNLIDALRNMLTDTGAAS